METKSVGSVYILATLVEYISKYVHKGIFNIYKLLSVRILVNLIEKYSEQYFWVYICARM